MYNNINEKKNQMFCECPDGIPDEVAIFLLGIDPQLQAPGGLLYVPRIGNLLTFNDSYIILKISFKALLTIKFIKARTLKIIKYKL